MDGLIKAPLRNKSMSYGKLNYVVNIAFNAHYYLIFAKKTTVKPVWSKTKVKNPSQNMYYSWSDEMEITLIYIMLLQLCNTDQIVNFLVKFVDVYWYSTNYLYVS